MIIVYVNNQFLVVSLERSCDIYGLHTVWKNHGSPARCWSLKNFNLVCSWTTAHGSPTDGQIFFFRPKVSLFQGLIIPKCYDCESLFRRYFSSTCYLIIPNRWYQKPTEACKSAPKYFRRYELIHGYGSKGLPVLPPTVDQLHCSEVFLRSNQF